jgi:hypothetical protein
MMGFAAGWPAGSVRWATTPVVIDGPAKSTYKSGKIITFCHWNLTTDVVTHRVAELPDGFIDTKGDANRTADVWDIRPNQVQGIFVMKLPHRGYLLVFLRRPAGVASLVIGGLALMLGWGLRNPSTRRGHHRRPRPSRRRRPHPLRLPPYQAALRERPETCRTARPSRPRLASATPPLVQPQPRCLNRLPKRKWVVLSPDRGPFMCTCSR